MPEEQVGGGEQQVNHDEEVEKEGEAQEEDHYEDVKEVEENQGVQNDAPAAEPQTAGIEKLLVALVAEIRDQKVVQAALQTEVTRMTSQPAPTPSSSQQVLQRVREGGRRIWKAMRDWRVEGSQGKPKRREGRGRQNRANANDLRTQKRMGCGLALFLGGMWWVAVREPAVQPAPPLPHQPVPQPEPLYHTTTATTNTNPGESPSWFAQKREQWNDMTYVYSMSRGWYYQLFQFADREFNAIWNTFLMLTNQPAFHQGHGPNVFSTGPLVAPGTSTTGEASPFAQPNQWGQHAGGVGQPAVMVGPQQAALAGGSVLLRGLAILAMAKTAMLSLRGVTAGAAAPAGPNVFGT